MCVKFNALQRSCLRFFDRQKIDLATVNLSSSDGVKSHLILHIFAVSTYVNVVYYQISIQHIGRFGGIWGFAKRLSSVPRNPISTAGFSPVYIYIYIYNADISPISIYNDKLRLLHRCRCRSISRSRRRCGRRFRRRSRSRC